MTVASRSKSWQLELWDAEIAAGRRAANSLNHWELADLLALTLPAGHPQPGKAVRLVGDSLLPPDECESDAGAPF